MWLREVESSMQLAVRCAFAVGVPCCWKLKFGSKGLKHVIQSNEMNVQNVKSQYILYNFEENYRPASLALS